jgi:glycerate kinase
MLVPPAQRNPWRAGSRGTGELLAHAARQNVGGILLGVGGSATNDLGFGALAALGFRFLNEKDEPIASPTPDRWESITRIERSPLKLPPVFIACDVINPLLGPTGATATFGPQKGLQPADQPKLEAQAARMAALLCAAGGKSLSLAATPGAGAAGGIAFGLMVACDAQLVPGYDLVSDWLDLPARLAAADLVLTGEGRFDATSLGGKGPGRLVAEAQRLGKPAHVFAGSVGLTPPGQTNGPEDNLIHAITPAGMPLDEALPRTAELLAAAIARVF